MWTIAPALVLASAIASYAQETASPLQQRIRIVWGGGEASRWFGRLELDRGTLSNLARLGKSPDSIGSVWLDQGKVHIAAISPRVSDSIEVTLTGGADSTLLVELAKDATVPRSEIPVAISDLQQKPHIQRLDDRGNTLRIEIVPSEAIQIETNREQLIFAPGEPFSLEIIASIAEAGPGTTLDFRTTLSSADGGAPVWSSDQRQEVPVNGTPRLRLNVPMPTAEGAYTMHCVVLRPSGFRDRFFGPTTAMAERTLEVVVLNPQREQQASPAEWATVLEIDPTSARWWERLPSWTQLRRIPGLNRGPLGSIRAGIIETSHGRFVELPATPPGMDPHWQAYSLPLEMTGAPHLLEIEYPAEQEQHLGISIVEPNSAGIIEGIGRDGGVYVEGFGRGNATATYRSIFWPRTHAPLLLVSNGRPGSAAQFGRIRVRKLESGQLGAGAPISLADERLVAAYIARPLIAETFGASKSHAAKPPADATDSDWSTVFECADRLSKYVQHAGYNGAVVSAFADGQTNYPSSVVAADEKSETERAGRLDALELLFRVFDREGLALMPALQFATPLPELETIRRASDPQTSGLEWVGPDGRTWLDSRGTTDGLAPYYNLLDHRVQEALIRAVSEVVSRYGKHQSFSGVAVQLSSRGYGQLPPLEWGLDDATVARFEQETGVRLNTSGPGRFAARRALLTGEHAASWRSWRTARVSTFYQRLASVVRTAGSNRSLILSTEDMFADSQLAAQVRPDLVGENRVEASFFDAGFDRTSLDRTPGLVICPARAVGTTIPLEDVAIDLEINQASANWHRQSGAGSPRATTLFHRPRRCEIDSFAARSPFEVSGDLTFVRQSMAHGAAARRPYVHALLDNDPAILLDGGELLPLGQEESLAPVRTILRQLPTNGQVAEISGQPVYVRTYTEPEGTTLLIMNASPWPAEAVLSLSVARSTSVEPLSSGATASGGSRLAKQMLNAGSQELPMKLEPYGVDAVRIAGTGVQIVGVQATTSEESKAELTSRLADLANRDLTAPHVYAAPFNPSFEPQGGRGPVPGWRVIGAAATAELDSTTPHEGSTCLYFQSSGDLVAIESDDFPIPPTGQLAMTVFARTHGVEPGTEMRIIFSADHAGQEYRRAFVVSGAQGAQRLSDQWRPFAILVNDLPLNSTGRMRVRFELSGGGAVWLDHVKLYDLLFPLKFYPNAQAEIKQFLILIHAAQRAVDAGRVTDGARLLEGYWPRFITSYTPPVQPHIASERAPISAVPSAPPSMTPADEEQEPSPSVSERIKRFIPSFVK